METTLQVTTNSLLSTAPGQVKQKRMKDKSLHVSWMKHYTEKIQKEYECAEMGKNPKKPKTTDKEGIRFKPETCLYTEHNGKRKQENCRNS